MPLAVTQPALPAARLEWAVVKCGLALIGAARALPPRWEVRVGAHVGPVIAGVVGHRMFQYDVWGDTVNVASRLQEAARPGRVCVLADVWQRLPHSAVNGARIRVNLRGKGEVELACLESAPPPHGGAANAPPAGR